MRTLAVGVMLGWALAGPWCEVARADGGTVRLSERRDGLDITVFTAPDPFRAGPVDISVMVLDADTSGPVPEASVGIRAWPRGRPGEAVEIPATTAAATNKLLRAAVFDLPEAGSWDVEAVIRRAGRVTRVRLELEAEEPLPPWTALVPWVGWPALVIAVYAIHQRLVWRRAHPRASSGRGT